MRHTFAGITVILLLAISTVQCVPVDSQESPKTTTDYQFDHPDLISFETLIKLLFLFAAFYFA